MRYLTEWEEKQELINESRKYNETDTKNLFVEDRSRQSLSSEDLGSWLKRHSEVIKNGNKSDITCWWK